MAVIIEAIDIITVVNIDELVATAQSFFIPLVGDEVGAGTVPLFKLEAEDCTILRIDAFRLQR